MTGEKEQSQGQGKGQEQWAYANNIEDNFQGTFDTKQDAIEEALANADEGETIHVGRLCPPIQPEEYWAAEDWLEHVSCQDDYTGDFADDWEESTEWQRQELEREVRAVMAAWLDRHKLRPRHFLVRDTEAFDVIDGRAVERKKQRVKVGR